MKYLKTILLLLIFSSAGAQALDSIDGQWYRLGIKNTAVYTLNLNFLKNYIKDTKKINPHKIRIFSASPHQLPQAISQSGNGNLTEIPVWCNDTDEKFDNKDFVKFLGVSTHFTGRDSKGVFFHKINPYCDSSYYFINISEADSKKIKTIESLSQTGEKSMQFFDYEEKELKNVLSSGREWLGDFFYFQYKKNYSLVDPVSDVNVKLNLMGIGRADQDLKITINKKDILNAVLPKSYFNPNDSYARYNRFSDFSQFEFSSQDDELEFELNVSTPNSPSAGAYIDFWEFNYERQLRFTNNSSIIFWPKNYKIKQYSIVNASQNTKIWRFDSAINPENLAFSPQGDFTVEAAGNDTKILIFDSALIQYPGFSGIPKQNPGLYAQKPEMIMVFPEKFRAEAQKLIENKKDNQDLDVLGISTQEVYDRFSGGKTDPSAIRDLCRFFWKKDNKTLKYLLLLGDASYDFKNNNKVDYVNIKTLIPTYESRESFEPIYSYSSDDYFGFLEDHEGEWPEGKSIINVWYSTESEDHSLDISVGRLPAKSQLEARNIINKIIRYGKFDADTKWQNNVTFVADNRDYNIHQSDAENLSDLLKSNSQGSEIKKIYLDDYEITNIENFPTAPKANETLNKYMEEGSFVINYNGHGSEEGWAQEKLLTFSDILNWRNQKQPILFTATCQFGKFDNPAIVSGAELSLLNATGGAIALLTTTRPVYSSTNEKINSAFYRNFNKTNTLGEWFRLTKNQSIEGELNRNFSLLGDPSLPLPVINNELIINQINSENTGQKVVKALEKIKIKGQSQNIRNGKVMISVFDKPHEKKTKGTYSDGPAYSYKSEFEKIYQGIFEIKEWQFEGEIMLPATQIPGVGKGKMHLFGIDTDSSLTSRGYFEDFLLNSEANGVLTDTSPPEISMISSENQNLKLEIFDESGINISTFSESVSPKIIINDTLELNWDKYATYLLQNQQILLKIPIAFLPTGKHKISIKVADLNNNITNKSFVFETIKPKLEITGYLGYPNPFVSYTNLIFQHNRPGENLEAIINVFDMYGRTVAEQQNTCNNCGDKIEFGLDFESKKDFGNQFVFKILLKSNSDNTSTQANGRLIFWK
ncbi:MAG: type IX secretion system sortase PorU [Cytophagaceae bacterium]|nr:type IX secretion system sortase PorU [Cytophagaceae bacterium]